MEEVPQALGMDLYEHYEASGYLLNVTSAGIGLAMKPGDFIVKRRWSTGSDPVVYNRARNFSDPRGDQ